MVSTTRSNPAAALLTAVSALSVVGVVFSSTLIQGGTSPIAILIARSFVLIGLGAFCAAMLTGAFTFHPNSRSVWAAVLAAVFAGLCFLQYYAGTETRDGWLRFGTAERHATLESAIQFVFYCIFVLVSVSTFCHRRLSQNLTNLFCLFLFGVTLFGILQRLSGTRKMYWLLDMPVSSFFGPFVYENSFGAFSALLFPMLLAVLVYRSLKSLESDALVDNRFAVLVRLGNSGAILMFFVAVLTLTGIFFAQARASALILSGMIAALFLLFWKNRFIQLLLLLSVAVTLFFGSLLNFSKIMANYDLTTWMKGDGRVRGELALNGLSMFGSRLLFGHGLGTFNAAGPRFITVPMDETAHEHPNNDAIELLAETGVVGFALMVAALALPVLSAAVSVGKTASLWTKALGLQAVLAIVALLLMSQFDSHLKVPSIAFLFACQLGILISQFGQSSPTAAAAHEKPHGLRPKQIAAALAGLILIVPLSAFARSDYSEKVWATQKADLLNDHPVALRLDPANPAYWQKKATAHYEKSLEIEDPDIKSAHLQSAISSISRAAELAPTYPHYAYVRGQLLYLSGDRAGGTASLERALELAPGNRRYGAFLLSIYCAEQKRVLSSVRRSEYHGKAAGLLRTMRGWKNPITDLQLRGWMPNYNESEIKALEQGVTS